MSTDNSTWVNVPLSKDTQKLVEIGDVQLNSFSVRIYVQYFLPPQANLNQTVAGSVQTIQDSFAGRINIQAPYTPQTDVIIFLVTIALISFWLQILDFLIKP